MIGSLQSFAPRIKGSGDSCMSMQNISPNSSVIFTSVPFHGVTELGIRSYPTGSWAPEAITTTFLCYGSVSPVYTTASFRPISIANLLLHWQYLSFLTSGIPTNLSRWSSRFLRTPLQRAGAPIWGNPRLAGIWTPSDCKLHINCLELKR